MPKQSISTLTNRLMVADWMGVQENMNVLLNCLFAQQKIDPEYFKLQAMELSTTFAKAAINGGASPQSVYSINMKYMTELNLVENIEQMKEWLRSLIQCFLDQILSSHNAHTLQSIQKALTYIEEHYTNQITLEDVAKHVHLSTNYFSSTFKHATGTSFVEYITKLRMEKAKQLLISLD